MQAQQGLALLPTRVATCMQHALTGACAAEPLPSKGLSNPPLPLAGMLQTRRRARSKPSCACSRSAAGWCCSSPGLWIGELEGRRGADRAQACRVAALRRLVLHHIWLPALSRTVQLCAGSIILPSCYCCQSTLESTIPRRPCPGVPHCIPACCPRVVCLCAAQRPPLTHPPTPCSIRGEAEKRRLLLEQLDRAGQQQLMRGRVRWAPPALAGLPALLAQPSPSALA